MHLLEEFSKPLERQYSSSWSFWRFSVCDNIFWYLHVAKVEASRLDLSGCVRGVGLDDSPYALR